MKNFRSLCDFDFCAALPPSRSEERTQSCWEGPFGAVRLALRPSCTQHQKANAQNPIRICVETIVAILAIRRRRRGGRRGNDQQTLEGQTGGPYHPAQSDDVRVPPGSRSPSRKRPAGLPHPCRPPKPAPRQRCDMGPERTSDL